MEESENMKILEIELTNKQRDSLKKELREVIYPKSDYSKYIKQLRNILLKYNCIFNKAIKYNNLSYSLPNFYGAVKFKNLPTDDNISMPPIDQNNYSRIDKNSYISENILVLIGLIYGEPYSMYYEGKGLVNNLIPLKKAKNDFTGIGSGVELGFHIENSALRFMTKANCSPKALLLAGVRQQRNSPITPISDAREALNLLKDKDIEILSQPQFKIKLPYRWRIDKNTKKYKTKYIPIINWENNNLFCNGAFYGNMIVEIKTKSAKIALNNFEKALYKTMIQEVIKPGEVICIDNRTMFHSRFSFDAEFNKYNQAYRWIQRIFITENLDNFKSLVKNSDRVFSPILK